MQVDVQSIKWISCKGMYKGYLWVLLYEPSGDPAKQFCNILSYFLRENLIMFSLTWKSICRCIHYQRRNGSCSTSLLHPCYTRWNLVSLFFFHLYGCFCPLWSSALCAHQSLVPLQSCVNAHRDLKQPLFHHTDWLTICTTLHLSDSSISAPPSLHTHAHTVTPLQSQPPFPKTRNKGRMDLLSCLQLLSLIISTHTHVHAHTCAHSFSTCASVFWRVGGGGSTLTNGIQEQSFILKHTDNAFHTYLPQQRWGWWAGSCPGLKAG